MSNKKTILNKKVAAGAALVALSGFVPQPMMQSAQAASASISVTGSFVTGIQLAAGTNAQFGVLAATDVNGTATLSTAGAVTPSKAVTAGGAPQAGSFQFTAVSTVPNVDITVSGLGAVVLAASAGGGGPTGTVKLNKVFLDNFATAAVTITDGGAGSGTATGVDINAATTSIKVGGQLTWGAVQPIGQFSEAIVLTIAY
ncbi:MAG: DUF4402 domain-containing protein [Alphaproteobacteria bacterium]|nr:DUF4402 domain-containing protein [Alphaproteobacteria bacterium]